MALLETLRGLPTRCVWGDEADNIAEAAVGRAKNTTLTPAVFYFVKSRKKFSGNEISTGRKLLPNPGKHSSLPNNGRHYTGTT